MKPSVTRLLTGIGDGAGNKQPAGREHDAFGHITGQIDESLIGDAVASDIRNPDPQLLHVLGGQGRAGFVPHTMMTSGPLPLILVNWAVRSVSLVLYDSAATISETSGCPRSSRSLSSRQAKAFSSCRTAIFFACRTSEM